MNWLDGKIALIMGGAGAIGLAAAQLFLHEGARVVLVDLSEPRL
jgi:NAD(P)-dependent dehydrogenase (short-subunit alcohol dehydrogenase family)